MFKQIARSICWLWLSSGLLAGCLAAPISVATPTAEPKAGSCTLTLPANVTDEQAIQAVLRAEGKLMVQQEIAPLMQLWAAGSQVVNAKNTPADTSDDQFWLDKDAIRHRYVRVVFPGAPSVATPADIAIMLTQTITDTRAVVTATTQIGSEVSPAGDRWELRKQNGCWVIHSLTFNLEAKKEE
jgi:hypothetical protein